MTDEVRPCAGTLRPAIKKTTAAGAPKQYGEVTKSEMLHRAKYIKNANVRSA